MGEKAGEEHAREKWGFGLVTKKKGEREMGFGWV